MTIYGRGNRFMDYKKFNYVNVPSVDSTNNHAKFFIDRNLSVDKPLIITASKQTAGRGRYGKSFYSPEGGLYMSYLFELTSFAEIDYIGYITPITALLVKQVIGRFVDDDISIKWVNDIYSKGLKVGGILTELVQTNTGASYIIIGIGLNCIKSEHSLPIPYDIFDSIGFLGITDLPKLIDELSESLYSVFPFKEDFDHRIYLDEYRKNCDTIGKKIAVKYKSGTSQRGIATDIDDDFRLIIKSEKSGEAITLSSVENAVVTLD